MRSGFKLGALAAAIGGVAMLGSLGLSSAQAQAPDNVDPIGATDGGTGGTGGTGGPGLGGTGSSGALDAGTPGIPDPAIPNGTDLPDNTMNQPQSGTEAIPPTTGAPAPAMPNPIGGADGGM